MTHSIVLRLPPDPGFSSALSACVGALARQFGLNQARERRLVLAVDELFCFLCRNLAGDEPVKIRVTDGLHRVIATFSCDFEKIDINSLSMAGALAARGDLNACGDALGLLLAARSSDRLRIRRRRERLVLRLEQDKAYPELAPGVPETVRGKGPLRVTDEPDPETVKEACRLTLANVPGRLVFHPLRQPGRFLDMIARGDAAAVVVRDAADQCLGLLCLLLDAPSSPGFFGPYVFDREQADETARLLIDGLLARLARTGAKTVHSLLATEDLPGNRFEFLGTLVFRDGEGAAHEHPFFFRQLGEDAGAAVYAHPDFAPFLRERYDRLDLPRDVRTVRDQGESLPEKSTLAADLRRELREAVLTLTRPGRDLADNLAGHVRTLGREGILNLYFHLDPGQAWQAGAVPALLGAGFVPRILVPGDGAAPDLAIFEHV